MKSYEQGSASTLPQARNSNLVVQETNDGILVYDLGANKAHHLNLISRKIWQNCDGETTCGELAKKLEKEFKTKIEPDLIFYALGEFRKSNLLENDFGNSNLKSVSRRDVLVKYALPAAVLPLVLSVSSVPTSAQAGGSCFANETPCTSDAQCCSGFCSTGFARNCQPAQP